MSCPDCRTFSVSKNLNIARGFFGVLASILFLSTIIVFGANMDYANYPGSNMVLKVVDGGDNDGEFVKLAGGDGFAIDKTHCTKNFIHTGTSAEGVAAGYCGAVEDDVPQALVVKDEDGKEASNKRAHGWTIMPPCVKSNKISDCAPFGVDSVLAGLGQATFGVLAINAVLTAAHTGVELGRPVSLRELNTSTLLFGLNIIWGILSFSLFVWSAVGWRGLCDKIDTGLGRQGTAGVAGCATTYCTISYGGLFASFAVAMVVYRVPDLLVMFGILGLESADDGL